MSLFSETYGFFKHLVKNKYLIYELTKRDFKSKYISSILGLFWAILEPLAIMVILWFVFGIGLRSGRNMEVPFVTYLITGIMAYTFFGNALSLGVRVLQQYAFLAKKVDFRLSILPVVKILSNLIVHGIIIIVVMIILLLNGIDLSVYWIQVVYYVFALGCLSLGITFATSSIFLFVPDIANILTILIRFLFYFTPIFWDINMMPAEYHFYLKINPLFFIVNGYRDSFLFRNAFWEYPWLNLYYWVFTISISLLGIIIFKKLKPHFADVI
jgi:lipopolysaccharide transport system permease protein/teichoic acid transport system permease protein